MSWLSRSHPVSASPRAVREKIDVSSAMMPRGLR